MRIIIAGSRTFNKYNLLSQETLNIIERFKSEDPNFDSKSLQIVSGMAAGADTLGEEFANYHGIDCAKFPADWNRYGKSAGFRRNEQMAIYAKEDNGVLIAFWDGISKGTGHMIDLATKHGLKVFVIKSN